MTSFIASERDGNVIIRVAGQQVANYPGKIPVCVIVWINGWLSSVGLTHTVKKFSCHNYNGSPRIIAIVERAE